MSLWSLMSSWSPQEDASGCWMSDYEYEGPGSTQNGNEFMIHATLEPGAEKYFSGIRVLIGCEDTKELATVAVMDNVGSYTLQRPWVSGDHSIKLDQTAQSILKAQQEGCKLAKQWQEGDSCATAALPLCTLVFEIVDRGDDVWERVNLVLHPLQAMEPQCLRPLYDYVEFCTPTSRSCVLNLSINHTFRGRPKPNDTFTLVGAFPSFKGILAHGVKILPPSASRRPFINLPSELLHMIFREVEQEKTRYNWRMTLISWALVCRAWRPALEHLYRNLASYNAGCIGPDALQLARTIELNPEVGQKIRAFDPNHFRGARETSEAPYLVFTKAVITILRSARFITTLHVCDTHRALAQDFVRALCSSLYVKEFCIDCSGPSMPPSPAFRYVLSIRDILRCTSHWPRVQTLSIRAFSSTVNTDGLPAPVCSLKILILQQGALRLPQLCLLTKSSYSTLQEVILRQIFGLTNEDLRTWLFEVGPALTSLEIEYTPLSRRSDAEEYAVDVVLPRMINLRRLVLEGDIASELVLLRYVPYDSESGQPPNSRRKRSMLTIGNMPGVNVHRFVNALRATEWTHITAKRLLFGVENMALKEEAQKIAQYRNVNVTYL